MPAIIGGMIRLLTASLSASAFVVVVILVSPAQQVAGQVPTQTGTASAKAMTEAWVDANADALGEVNRKIWGYAETGLEETKSSEELQTVLRSNGFDVEGGVAGMPTAFVASYGSGRPVIGLLAEFDALPGLSQGAVPERLAREGITAGHGCGHSVFGTGSTAAAIAVKQAIEAGHLQGTVRLYGTPAEETGLGKTYMLRAGFFRDDDAILTWHAGDRTAAGFAYTKAVVSVKFHFSGLPAHASTSPHQGRSALDAVELMANGVNYMREHVKEDARIHYVITNGGGQPNVVPPEAEVWFYIRADKHTDVEAYYEWVKEIAEGAAVMTRTELTTVQVDSDMHEVLPNRRLAEIIHHNLELVGPPQFTQAEKDFARQTQEALDGEFEISLSEVIEPLPERPTQGLASTDVGDISWFVPVGRLRVATYTFGAPGHSWQIVACTGTSIGERGMLVAAKTLAGAVVDLLSTPDDLDRAKADLANVRESLEYITLIPDGQQAPRTIR